jgi:hypothetical protein
MDKAGLGHHFEAEQDVVMSVTGVVKPGKFLVDNRPVRLSPEKVAFEEDFGGPFGRFR